MRQSRALAIASVLSAIAVVGVAVAQPRRPPPKPPKPPAADAGASDNPYSDDKPGAKSDAGAAPAASATASASAGPVAPPPAGQTYDGGVKPSPLTPAPPEFSDAGVPPTTLDYDRLLADVAALRARVAAVQDNMFRSKLAVLIETSGDHGKIARLAVSLDDGVVYTAPNGFHADDMTAVYEHSVAPGRHAVTIDVDRKDDRDESFRTSQKSRFIVDVPRDNRLELQVKIWDDSTMGGDFPGDRSGRYELKIRAKAQAKPVGAGAPTDRPGAGR